MSYGGICRYMDAQIHLITQETLINEPHKVAYKVFRGKNPGKVIVFLFLYNNVSLTFNRMQRNAVT